MEAENVRGVITMNEEYETKYFCNSAEVGLLVLVLTGDQNWDQISQCLTAGCRSGALQEWTS